METENSSTEALRWRFDVHAFRLLGRDLITDRVTALFELVKNSYDADATEVFVEFYNTKTISEHSKIIIRDNGEGMSFEDIQNKWMVVGTNSKRTRTHSLKFNRRLVGEKGIGRFAVDKLGGLLKLRTKKENEQEVSVTIDWGEYEKAAEKKMINEQMILFTEIDNPVTYDEKTIDTHGTILEISNLHEIWSEQDLQRADLELSKIVSPFVKTDNFFDIYIDAKEYNNYKEQTKVKSTEVKHFSDNFKIGFNKDKNLQEVLSFDEKTGTIVIQKRKIFSFGPIKLKLYHFNQSAKQAFNTEFKNLGVYIDGIKIYRDGVISTPFAETQFHRDKKRDILGIDKRLWRDTFNKVSTREVIGFLDITKKDNPNIVDSTSRQDFIDNEAYRDLKKFIISQLEEIEKYKSAVRKDKLEKGEQELEKAENDIDSLINIIESIAIDTPLISPYLDTLKKQAKKAKKSLKTGKKQTQQFKEEALRKENIYISLMSLQDYAANIAHAVRTSLSATKDYAEFFKDNYPNEKYEDLFMSYAVEIYNEMQKLDQAMDFMLSYAQSNNEPEDFNLKELIINLLSKTYELKFKNEDIRTVLEIKDNVLINTNKKFIEDVFQNLIANSIKALSEEKDKIIKCSGYIDKNDFICYFSDNGCGISEDDKDDIFNLYFTNTANQGGAGLGLYIVKTRMEALKGTIELVESEFSDKGTTFKITLPFNKR